MLYFTAQPRSYFSASFKYNWPALHWVFPVRFHLYDGSSIFLAVPDLAQLPLGLHQLSSHSADWRIDRCNFISFFLHCPNLFWKLLETTLKFTESRFIPVFLIVLLLKTWLKIVCLGICKLGWNKRSLCCFCFSFLNVDDFCCIIPTVCLVINLICLYIKKRKQQNIMGIKEKHLAFRSCQLTSSFLHPFLVPLFYLFAIDDLCCLLFCCFSQHFCCFL